MVRARAIPKRIAIAVGLACAVLYGGLIALRVLYPVAHLDLVRDAAGERGLDPATLCSLIRAESRFHSDAVSVRGAIGLMQIMPDTGRWIAEQTGLLGFDPGILFDPRTNLRLGTWYLRYLLDRFGGLEPALMAYHAGPTRVDGWLASGEIPYSGTRAYVERVLRAVPIYQAALRWPIVVRITPSLPL
ncbi:MAG: lytic transglycosylase domain-containing protein [Candidatus Bipolaricaulis sp.]|nr:lytic transglycosylase domain-containing protein [Candidatus Bipolaricaulis sp.]MDD5219754.1 lytic transglycosylase domain-containing protein [Candidatus Bipolaricaulis sp.]MDD5645823.1 lytic transglycosylase domain-containing protein [Candidatus Bipolaricaulis sp.]